MKEAPIDRITREMIYGKEAAARHPPTGETVLDQLMREIMHGKGDQGKERRRPTSLGREKMIWPEGGQREARSRSTPEREPEAPGPNTTLPARHLAEISAAAGASTLRNTREMPDRRGVELSEAKPPETHRSMRWSLMRELAQEAGSDVVTEIMKQQTLKLEIARQLARDVSGPERDRLQIARMLARDTGNPQIAQITRHQTARLELLRDVWMEDSRERFERKPREREERDDER